MKRIGGILSAMIVVGALWTAPAVSQMDESRPMQGPDDRRTPRLQEDLITFEPFYRSITADSMSADILFRVRRDFLVFTRSDRGPTYSAKAEITVEILDSTESSITRSIRTFYLLSDDNSQAYLKRSYEEGLVSFRLKQGRYMALCIVTDMESEHKQFVRVVHRPPSFSHSRSIRSRASSRAISAATDFSTALSTPPQSSLHTVA